MSRWTAIRIKFLVAISVDRLRVRTLLLLLQTQARLAHYLVTFFVNEQFALDALESLSAETPDSILAERAEGSLKKITKKSQTDEGYYITSRASRVRISRYIATLYEACKSCLSFTKKRCDNARALQL
jgi:hypothetical protein